jgi:hypothetical protein
MCACNQDAAPMTVARSERRPETRKAQRVERPAAARVAPTLTRINNKVANQCTICSRPIQAVFKDGKEVYKCTFCGQTYPPPS